VRLDPTRTQPTCQPNAIATASERGFGWASDGRGTRFAIDSLLEVIVFVYALAADLRVMARWVERPYLFVFPAIGAIATIALARHVLRREDGAPFYMVALIFAAAFGTLAISFWPYMIPFSITIEEAAAPHSSLAFMFWGAGLFVFPLMLIYTAISYSVFRGKVKPTSEPY
jgi:cytochrome d ubiquinol oxidase subunit II